MNIDTPDGDLLRLTANIVSAYLSKNSIPAGGLPELIHSVYAALSRAGTAPPAARETRQLPAVPIKKSVFPSYIVCVEDGKKLKMLKRHLQTSYAMTPDDYRAKWNLPDDYPMVAPDYAARRSILAKENGLGRKPEPITAPAPTVEIIVAAEPEVAEFIVQRIPARKRGRKPGSKNQVRDLVDMVAD
jgi:predicted transcriptional regulator